MSDQPASDHPADEPGRSAEGRHGRDDGEHGQAETIQFGRQSDQAEDNPAHEKAGPPASYTEFHTPGYGQPSLSESPPRPLSGFRSEQRFSEPSGLTQATQPPEWEAHTPPNGNPASDPFPGRRPYYSPPSPPAPQHAEPQHSAPQHSAPQHSAQTDYLPVPDFLRPPDYPQQSAAPAPLPVPYEPNLPQTPYPDLSTNSLLREVKPPPATGWRRALYVLSGKLINVGESPRDLHHNELVAHVNQPLGGCYRIAVVSLKGGVGKTTITATLGSTFGSIRGDRVIAVDANPDFGTLAQRGPNNCDSTVRTLLNDPTIVRYSDVRRHTSQGPNRLEFLGSERDPAVSESFSENDYRAVHATLDRFYNIILTDCGTGLTHSVTKGVLDTADSLVVVGSPSIDSARSVLATIDWLAHHGYSHLIADAVVVLSAAWSDYLPVDLDQLSRHFEQRVSRVVFVPYDAHLAEGGQIRVDLLSHKTQQAYADLASHLTAGSLVQP